MAKINPNDPATGHEYGKTIIGGLTIRAQIAAMVMQGILANCGMGDKFHMECIANIAIKQADELIKQLNEK